jgi:hypothetical protein
MMRKSFVFYLSWKEMIKSLSDEELRRFINNLISWHQGEGIKLTTSTESAIWSLIEPALVTNNEKWNSRANSSRENGKFGGRPKKEITQETQQVYEEPIKPVKSEVSNDECEMSTGECEVSTGECEELDVIGKKTIVNEGVSRGSFLSSKIKKLNDLLVTEYPQYPYLVSMANPRGIKELWNHIENKEELDKITKILNELASSKKEYRGHYD